MMAPIPLHALAGRTALISRETFVGQIPTPSGRSIAVSAPHVCIRAVDADDTFLYWRWSDSPNEFYSAKVGGADLAGALTNLHQALPLPMPGERDRRYLYER